MRESVKKITPFVTAFTVTAIVLCLLQIASRAFNGESVRHNARLSAATLAAEGNYPLMTEDNFLTTRDNYTDAVIIA